MTSTIFERLRSGGFEQVLFHQDARTGLRSLVVLHDTTLGPALGGVRMHAYASETAALEDGLRLARAMTLKAAAAGLDLGGGWSVVLGDPARDKTEALLRAHGRFVATLGGRFIPVNDVGTTQADLKVIGTEAAPVCADGDPSPMTALGVLEGIRACLRATGGDGGLRGVRVCVQGVGNVGAALARLLAAQDAELLVSDVDPGRADAVARSVGARVVDPAAAALTACDVLAPCALGGVVDDRTLPRLRCRIIAGGANNVLAAPEHAAALEARGVLYAPDFCVNAGGLVFLEERLRHHDDARTEQRVRQVGERVATVIEHARRTGVPPTAAALTLARARLSSH
ncbi:Leu/Phe/Val dehydrogenase [Streptomyces flavofungini]|uniref:Leu/Phe/Val dehydrogenase n=1 Tax=Streptomyces flavofungini TaxID=68200 RepID=UPI0025AEE82C|nr:Glu/Leu/Phe/Val dehydrogenase dimerization domain-containing protein [Streptomyces flavofungini]WJV50847.1 Glu/Leu/Phe/Val dehydrogenase dimerization domain-containing protein [Streptomyces flavofungini]